MVASVDFIAIQSKKYIRITDLYPAKPNPKTSKLLNVGDDFTVSVETFDEETGLVKVEVSSDGKTFTKHDPRKRVVHGQAYEIDG